MNDQAKKRATTLVREAEARLASFTLFGFGVEAKHSDAADKFKMAGNQFILAQAWEEAGDAFTKAGTNFKVVGEKLEYVNSLVSAAQAYKKDKLLSAKAIEAFILAIDDYNMNGRFSRSAQYLKEVAEIYEADDNYEMAIETYEQTAQLHLNDNKPSQAQKIQLQIATMLSEKIENYEKASSIYYDVGQSSMESNLGKFSAKGHFFCYLLCLTAMGDCVALSEGLEKCKNIDYSFGTSRECTFMEKICESIQNSDSEMYATACAEFDNISPLDPWKTTLLLKGRKHMDVDAGDDNNDDDVASEGGDDGDLC